MNTAWRGVRRAPRPAARPRREPRQLRRVALLDARARRVDVDGRGRQGHAARRARAGGGLHRVRSARRRSRARAPSGGRRRGRCRRRARRRVSLDAWPLNGVLATLVLAVLAGGRRARRRDPSASRARVAPCAPDVREQRGATEVADEPEAVAGRRRGAGMTVPPRAERVRRGASSRRGARGARRRASSPWASCRRGRRPPCPRPPPRRPRPSRSGTESSASFCGGLENDAGRGDEHVAIADLPRWPGRRGHDHQRARPRRAATRGGAPRPRGPPRPLRTCSAGRSRRCRSSTERRRRRGDRVGPQVPAAPRSRRA